MFESGDVAEIDAHVGPSPPRQQGRGALKEEVSVDPDKQGLSKSKAGTHICVDQNPQ